MLFHKPFIFSESISIFTLYQFSISSKSTKIQDFLSKNFLLFKPSKPIKSLFDFSASCSVCTVFKICLLI